MPSPSGTAKSGLVAGVYLWINRENGKMYVGSSINLRKRMSRYFSLERAHGIIGQGLRKYGLNGFILVILLVPEATAPLVLSLEQFVLDSGICAYNILPTAGSSAGAIVSDETKEKMSEAHKGRKHTEESKEKMSAAKKGRKGPNHTEESKEKISATMKGLKLSDETKSKISAALKGKNYNKGKVVYLYLVHSDRFELAATFPNVVRCSETLGVPYTTLVDRIKNRILFEINGLQHIVSRDGNLA